MGLVSVVLVLGAVLGVVGTGQAQLRCADAARAAAREAARGEDADRVGAVARQVAGERASVAVVADAPWVRVRVSVPVTLPLPGSPVVEAAASAHALVELP